MTIKDKLLDELLKECQSPEDVLGKDGLLKQLTKRMLERALEAEMTTELGYEKHAITGRGSGNSRNGHSKKRVQGEFGQLRLDVPRDRNGEFEPKIIAKHQRRTGALDTKIISLYARGLSTREIQGHLLEIYGVEVSPTLISNVTDAVLDEARSWQNRPLDSVYPIVFLDALRVKIREEGHILNKAVYLALGVNLSGHKELLGLWIANTEGAKFWLNVLTEINNRGVEDIFIACVDGLEGFSEAIETVFPKAEVQVCIVHMIRNSLKYVSWKDRKAVIADLKKIYQSPTLDGAEQALVAFSTKWDGQYPAISQSWRRHWDEISTMFAYPKDIRRAIYTTNAIEAINRQIRKVIKTRGSFPNDDSALKLLYLALENASKKWTMPIQNWKPAMNRFMILFPGRVPLR